MMLPPGRHRRLNTAAISYWQIIKKNFIHTTTVVNQQNRITKARYPRRQKNTAFLISVFENFCSRLNTASFQINFVLTLKIQDNDPDSTKEEYGLSPANPCKNYCIRIVIMILIQKS